MKTMIVLAAMMVASTLFAQQSPTAELKVPKLAKSYKGKWWQLNADSGREQSNTAEFEILTQDEDGKFTGTFSRSLMYPSSISNICWSARQLPMSGTFDGDKLAFTVKASQNHPSCQDYTWTMARGKEHYFERETPDGRWKVYFDPAN